LQGLPRCEVLEGRGWGIGGRYEPCAADPKALPLANGEDGTPEAARGTISSMSAVALSGEIAALKLRTC
jgi:hypothetical protein